ncbi:MAG: ribosomal protein S18-alanine N-acetyltransferase [Gammaproteobacteria bacterium]|nr:ribosomal protein S18-alanine N-acetyltransferase [Gammaproteobacteria bacterium]
MSAVLKPAVPQCRPMRASDLDDVLAIERAAYPFPWSEAIFRDCLRVGYCCWVLELNHAVTGYGIMQVAAGESHVLNLCIHPAYHRQGYGRHLLGRLLDLAREHHADLALLEVRPTNQAAVALYRGMGFNEVGIRRAYYPGHRGKEDALILARSLVN